MRIVVTLVNIVLPNEMLHLHCCQSTSIESIKKHTLGFFLKRWYLNGQTSIDILNALELSTFTSYVQTYRVYNPQRVSDQSVHSLMFNQYTLQALGRNKVKTSR